MKIMAASISNKAGILFLLHIQWKNTETASMWIYQVCPYNFRRDYRQDASETPFWLSWWVTQRTLRLLPVKRHWPNSHLNSCLHSTFSLCTRGIRSLYKCSLESAFLFLAVFISYPLGKTCYQSHCFCWISAKKNPIHSYTITSRDNLAINFQLWSKCNNFQNKLPAQNTLGIHKDDFNFTFLKTVELTQLIKMVVMLLALM